MPVGVLGGLIAVALIVFGNPPQAQRRPPARAAALTVETRTLEATEYPVVLESYGVIQPRTRSQVVAQVSGQVIEVGPGFRDGGYFEAGEMLLRIDPRDYEADMKIAEAQLIEARQGLIEAQAQVKQALDDWNRLGRSGEPSDLVLKKPQEMAAQARVRLAESNLEKARLNLERTEVRAPYAGRTLDLRVDRGTVVSANTVLAEIYAVDVIEVRLPLRNRDLQFIELPEQFRNDDGIVTQQGNVLLYSDLGGEARWIGDLIRTEGAIDGDAQLLHVVAQVEDPFGENRQNERPLKIGQYVTARVAGRVLEDVIVIPNAAIYQGAYVYTVVDELLQRTEVSVLWQNEDEAVIEQGLKAGDELVLTPLGQVTSGTRVTVGERRPEVGADARMGNTGETPATQGPDARVAGAAAGAVRP